jgi:FixJ family two-component response regulator
MNENNPLICVIDDESVVRESLSFLLCSAGLKVQALSSAQEFLTNPPVEPVGCLVVDVQLPGISGLDLLCGKQPEVLQLHRFSDSETVLIWKYESPQ